MSIVNGEFGVLFTLTLKIRCSVRKVGKSLTTDHSIKKSMFTPAVSGLKFYNSFIVFGTE